MPSAGLQRRARPGAGSGTARPRARVPRSWDGLRGTKRSVRANAGSDARGRPTTPVRHAASSWRVGEREQRRCRRARRGPPPCLPVPRERDQSSASQARHPPHWLAGWPAGGCSRRACGGRRRGRRCEDKCRALCRCAAIRAPAAGFCALCHCPLLLPAAGEGKGGPPVAGCRPGALRQGVLVGGIG